jgi:hypothetical protein
MVSGRQQVGQSAGAEQPVEVLGQTAIASLW